MSEIRGQQWALARSSPAYPQPPECGKTLITDLCFLTSGNGRRLRIPSPERRRALALLGQPVGHPRWCNVGLVAQLVRARA